MRESTERLLRREFQKLQERDANTQLKLDKAYRKLAEGDETGAQDILHDYMPVGAGDDMHYSLYKLEQVQFFEEEFLKPSKFRYGHSFVRVIENLVDSSHKVNATEINKLMTWFKSEGHNTHEKLRLSESGLNTLFMQPFDGSPEKFNAFCKQLVDAYKDKFELVQFIIFLANLILIKRGHAFSETPFQDYLIKYQNRLIHKNKRVEKGLAVRWLYDNLQGQSRYILYKSYNVNLRNMSGHNDYSTDYSKGLIASSAGYKFKVKEAQDLLKNMQSLQMAILIESSIKQFEYGPLRDYWINLGLMDWHYVAQERSLYIAQYFGNFSNKKRLKTVKFYTPPFKGKEDMVSLAFNGDIVTPYDQRVVAGKTTLEMLRQVLEAEKISVSITAVAPQVRPFTELNQEPIRVMNAIMIPVNQHTESNVKVDRTSLRQVIDTLENQKLD